MSTPLKVLILEDNPADAELLLQHLRNAGYVLDSRWVDNEAGFMAALEPDLDVILADYMLPDWSGTEALAAAERTGFDLPVIIVSGAVGDESAAAVIKQGAADFLLKDRLARLGAAVAHAMASTRLRRERREAQAALLIAHSQLSQLLERSPAVLYVLKIADGKIVSRVVSESIARLLGYTSSETLAFDWWLNRLHPEDRERALNSVSETLVSGVSRTEYRLRHKDGQYCWIGDTLRLVRDANGHAIELAGVWIDITARKQAEAERERLMEELKAAQAHVRTLSGLLPICASCKKIRDSEGRWSPIESYIQGHSEAQFTHSMCPDCTDLYYAGMRKCSPVAEPRAGSGGQ
ncbi:MAG TPA: PAS domain-containing protein [Lacunisphaera sp.]